MVGAEALRRQAYMSEHKPKKKERRIYLICSDLVRRVELIGQFKHIFELCREAYRKVKQGLHAEWPPGTFIPWLPPWQCDSSLTSC